jgi:hypothetical protein
MNIKIKWPDMNIPPINLLSAPNRKLLAEIEVAETNDMLIKEYTESSLAYLEKVKAITVGRLEEALNLRKRNNKKLKELEFLYYIRTGNFKCKKDI